jgi:hypothetical protein
MLVRSWIPKQVSGEDFGEHDIARWQTWLLCQR